MPASFCFISERTFESWDWTSPEARGIGGSETSHIEMAQRLRRRGHSVISFAPLEGQGGPIFVTSGGELWRADPAGVDWCAVENFQYAAAVLDVPHLVNVIYRAPQLVDDLPADAIAWLVCQDVDYPGLTEERALRFTRIIALCERHAEHLRRRLPAAADRICISSNGVKFENIQAIRADPPARNPRRLTYASSPDRGLENLLPIFERVKELVPDAELHVCYGFDNIDKVIKYSPAGDLVAENKRRLLSEMDRLGVIHHGRIGQTELLKEWFQTAVWCHPSNFTETSCITCMDAQACGAVPVTSPVWAIAENVRDGVFIEGDVRLDMIRARYVREVAELLLNPAIAQGYRDVSMTFAPVFFNWDRFVFQWEGWAALDAIEAKQRRAAAAAGSAIAAELPAAPAAVGVFE